MREPSNLTLRDWESRLGIRLDSLEAASPADRADIHRKLLGWESRLDPAALPICERLLPLLNVKNAREHAELIVRRWPDSPLGRELAATMRAKAQRSQGKDGRAVLQAAAASWRPGARYWIKVAGTGDNPAMHGDWAVGHHKWARQYGHVSMFPRRPRIERGDRMVHYAAGSHARFGEGRIYLVVEVTSQAPEPSAHERWPWMVRGRYLIAGPRLEHCPLISDIDVQRSSLRRQSHIHLTDQQGRRAEELIAHAAERYGGLDPG